LNSTQAPAFSLVASHTLPSVSAKIPEIAFLHPLSSDLLELSSQDLKSVCLKVRTYSSPPQDRADAPEEPSATNRMYDSRDPAFFASGILTSPLENFLVYKV